MSVRPGSDHYIPSFVRPGSDPRRDRFVAEFKGLGQVAAVNRPGFGQPFDPIRRVDDPSTPDLIEDQYTREFGGTSGAAPIVSGVAALMLSVNPDLTAEEVRLGLMATADTGLDPALDLTDDPNLQGLTGEFVGGRSRYFGSGKVNAFHAVRRARALLSVGLGRSAISPTLSAVNAETVERDAIKDQVINALSEATGISSVKESDDLFRDLGMTPTFKAAMALPYTKISEKHGGSPVRVVEATDLETVKESVDLVHKRANRK